MLLSYLLPQQIAPNIESIDYPALWRQGYRVILFDIDNTIVPYEIAQLQKNHLEFFDGLTQLGFKIAFVSNNNENRVKQLNQKLQYFAVADARKPSRRGYKKAIAYFDCKPQNCIVIGDQIFTDIFAGRRCGCYTILVPPIQDKRSLLFRAKRFLERPVLRAFQRQNERAVMISPLESAEDDRLK